MLIGFLENIKLSNIEHIEEWKRESKKASSIMHLRNLFTEKPFENV